MASFLAAQGANAKPGEGINLGNVRFTPVVQLNFSYEYNVRRQSEEVASRPNAQGEVVGIISSPVLEVRPSFSAAYRTDDIWVTGAVENVIKRYFSENAQGLSYFDDLYARLEGDFFRGPGRRFGLLVKDGFNHRNYAGKGEGLDEDSSGAGDSYLIERTFNDLLVEGRFSPGSALDLNLGVQWVYDRQDYFGGLTTSDSYEPPSKNELGVQARARWRFFPRTMLMAQLEYGRGRWQDLPECTAAVSPTGVDCTSEGAILLNKSDVVDQWVTYVGIAGQFTSRIQANLFFGYGGLYNSAVEDADAVGGAKGLLGETSIVYSANDAQTQNLTVGFRRNFSESPYQDFIVSNQFSAGYSGLFIDRLAINAYAALDLRELNSADVQEYHSHLERGLYGSLGGEYKITGWLTGLATFRPVFVFAGESEDTSEQVSVETLQESFGFSHWTLILGARGIY